MTRIETNRQPLAAIESWQAADEIVRKIGNLQQQIAADEKKATGDINKIKEELAERTKKPLEQIDSLTASLEAFAVGRKDEFINKSRELNFGVLGWRKSTVVSITKKTLELIKKCLPKSVAAACVRNKESVDKEALVKLTEEQLNSVGARRESREVFFVEPSQTKAVKYEKNG